MTVTLPAGLRAGLENMPLFQYGPINKTKHAGTKSSREGVENSGQSDRNAEQGPQTEFFYSFVTRVFLSKGFNQAAQSNGN